MVVGGSAVFEWWNRIAKRSPVFSLLSMNRARFFKYLLRVTIGAVGGAIVWWWFVPAWSGSRELFFPAVAQSLTSTDARVGSHGKANVPPLRDASLKAREGAMRAAHLASQADLSGAIDAIDEAIAGEERHAPLLLNYQRLRVSYLIQAARLEEAEMALHEIIERARALPDRFPGAQGDHQVDTDILVLWYVMVAERRLDEAHNYLENFAMKPSSRTARAIAHFLLGEISEEKFMSFGAHDLQQPLTFWLAMRLKYVDGDAGRAHQLLSSFVVNPKNEHFLEQTIARRELGLPWPQEKQKHDASVTTCR